MAAIPPLCIQISTPSLNGFFPFELLCGHEVRGSLSLLKEIWEGDKRRRGSVNIVSNVVQMRD